MIKVDHCLTYDQLFSVFSPESFTLHLKLSGMIYIITEIILENVVISMFYSHVPLTVSMVLQLGPLEHFQHKQTNYKCRNSNTTIVIIIKKNLTLTLSDSDSE